jgi:hypothetical protein
VSTPEPASLYFFDPNGHRVELACFDPQEDALLCTLDAVKWEMLEEWSRTKLPAKACSVCARRGNLYELIGPEHACPDGATLDRRTIMQPDTSST